PDLLPLLPAAPPTGVMASDGTSAAAVTVTWNASAGATSYRVYRDGVLIVEAAAATYDDTGAGAGVPTVPTSVAASDGTFPEKIVVTFAASTAPAGPTHTYTVSAVNAGGESAQSAGDSGFRGPGVNTYLIYRDGTQIASIA